MPPRRETPVWLSLLVGIAIGTALGASVYHGTLMRVSIPIWVKAPFVGAAVISGVGGFIYYGIGGFLKLVGRIFYGGDTEKAFGAFLLGLAILFSSFMVGMAVLNWK